MHSTCPPRVARGITLIETLMVIVLLAAAAITSSVLLDDQWIAKRSVTDRSGDVAAGLNAARNAAITRQAAVQVHRIRKSNRETLLVTQEAGPFGPSTRRTIDLGGDIRLSGSPREIRFTPTGGANRALNWTIRRSDSVGRVSVSPTDGQITRSLP